MRKLCIRVAASVIVILARFVTAVHARWQGTAPRTAQCIYYANHCSHGDFVLLWTVLPPVLRQRTRPVAGADYWLTSPLRRFIGRDVFRAVLVERDRSRRDNDPIAQMSDVLDAGESLIIFPEGTRNTGESRLLPFKSGLFHLARLRPDIDLVPVWISNLNRVLPKGEVIPIPLVCSVTFGAPLARVAKEDKKSFLSRAELALQSLDNGGSAAQNAS
ncbi:MAG: 1-acyl-sn-glycerol-3-phosphate acyltransferase [Granulosicoccus sp.]|nr:1-acyl-sn-glycerol-3-phosphate acyltransferase [Granulosicoccus sp.]